jgi:dUTPase
MATESDIVDLSVDVDDFNSSDGGQKQFVEEGEIIEEEEQCKVEGGSVSVKVKYQSLKPITILPDVVSNGSGYNVICSESFRLSSKKTIEIYLGFKLQVPAGVLAHIYSESADAGISVVSDIITSNHNDEIKVKVTNNGLKTIHFERSGVLGQIVYLRIIHPEVSID